MASFALQSFFYAVCELFSFLVKRMRLYWKQLTCKENIQITNSWQETFHFLPLLNVLVVLHSSVCVKEETHKSHQPNVTNEHQKRTETIYWNYSNEMSAIAGEMWRLKAIARISFMQLFLSLHGMSLLGLNSLIFLIFYIESIHSFEMSRHSQRSEFFPSKWKSTTAFKSRLKAFVRKIAQLSEYREQISCKCK